MAIEPEEERPGHEDEGGPVKSFLEHLEDLRWTLIKCAVATTVAMLLCLIAGDKLVWVLKRPLERAKIKYPGNNQVVTVMFATNRLGTFQLAGSQRTNFPFSTNRFITLEVAPALVGTNVFLAVRENTNAESAGYQKLAIDLINLSPVGGFVVALQVALYGGLVLAAPFLFYFIGQFVFPALKRLEKKYLYRGLSVGVALFMTGVCFCYFVLMPVALAASMQYSNWLGFSATQWRAEDYMSFVCKFMLGMGLGFELPVVILTLVKIGILNYGILSKARRYMIVINLILGALLTTPEVVTQVLMALPLQLLYEISVWIAWYWDQEDRAKARRRLAQVLVVIVLVGLLGWLAYKYGWPWLRQHRP
jgi:sec-independent protein translocase protein TatC